MLTDCIQSGDYPDRIKTLCKQFEFGVNKPLSVSSCFIFTISFPAFDRGAIFYPGRLRIVADGRISCPSRNYPLFN